MTKLYYGLFSAEGSELLHKLSTNVTVKDLHGDKPIQKKKKIHIQFCSKCYQIIS